MFNSKEISATLVAKYAAAKADGSYNPRTNGTRLDLREGDTVTQLEGPSDLASGEFDRDGKKTKSSWPTITVRIAHADGSIKEQTCSISNIDRGAFFVGTPDRNNQCEISQLQPRLGRRGYILTSEDDVKYTPQDVVLGTVKIAKVAYRPAQNGFTKGSSKVTLEKIENLAYIPAE